MPEKLTFKKTLAALINRGTQGNREKTHEKAYTDLIAVCAEASEVLAAATNDVLSITCTKQAERNHVPQIGNVLLYRIEIFNNADSQGIGPLEVFRIPENNAYPILTSGDIPLGDREALEMMFYKFFGQSRSTLYDIIVSIQEI